MRGMIWTGEVARLLLPLVEWHYQYGRDLDVEFNDEDLPRTVSLAQILAGVLPVPDQDRHLLAVCRREGLAAAAGVPWSLAVLAEDRLGVVAQAGVIESSGEHLGLVESPESGRYTGFFYLPGVAYVGGGPG